MVIYLTPLPDLAALRPQPPGRGWAYVATVLRWASRSGSWASERCARPLRQRRHGGGVPVPRGRARAVASRPPSGSPEAGLLVRRLASADQQADGDGDEDRADHRPLDVAAHAVAAEDVEALEDPHDADEQQRRRPSARGSPCPRACHRGRTGLALGSRPMRVVVLGAGFGGLELTTRLSDELGDDVDVTLIDQADGFIFGFSKLDVMFGKAQPDAVHHAYADIVKPGVRFVQATITVDRSRGQARRDRRGRLRRRRAGGGARRRPPPGGHARACSRRVTSSTRCPAPSRAATCSRRFDGGRVIVAVTSTPFKCPPAPSETALLVHDFLVDARAPRPIGDRAGDADAACRSHRRRRRRRRCWRRSRSAASPGTASSVVRELDPATKVARLADGGRDALRPVPRRPGAPRARRWSRSPG